LVDCVRLDIDGLGIIFYSPFAVSHIAVGEDYLQRSFVESEDIVRHVNACTLSAFGTGGPGKYELIIDAGDADRDAWDRAQFKLELGLEVRDGVVCFRDLYDLLDWDPDCPAGQRIAMPDGFYRIAAYRSYAEVGRIQPVALNFTKTDRCPSLAYTDAPHLCS
jgi:hypothetical protein